MQRDVAFETGRLRLVPSYLESWKSKPNLKRCCPCQLSIDHFLHSRDRLLFRNADRLRIKVRKNLMGEATDLQRGDLEIGKFPGSNLQAMARKENKGTIRQRIEFARTENDFGRQNSIAQVAALSSTFLPLNPSDNIVTACPDVPD